MDGHKVDTIEEILSHQRQLWEDIFSHETDVYGKGPSSSARKAAALFKKEGKTRIVELGCGQGRDALYFAQLGFHVCVVDYCESGVKSLVQKALSLDLSSSIEVVCHDIRKPFPFKNESFDGCYSHILYCCLGSSLCECLLSEIRRILKKRGLNFFTVRTTEDPVCGTGTSRGKDIYEVDGFLLHFFDRERVMRLAKGFEIVQIEEIKEDPPHQKVLQGTFRKMGELSNIGQDVSHAQQEKLSDR